MKEVMIPTVGMTREKGIIEELKDLKNQIRFYETDDSGGTELILPGFIQKVIKECRDIVDELSESKTYNGKELVIVNTGSVPAFMVRLKLCSAEGEQILPIYYSDNYFHLLPGERKTINIGWKAMDIPGTLPPLLHVSGFNVPDIEYKY